VQAKATVYPIGKRVRFHQNLKAAGQIPDKRFLAIETRPATPDEAKALKLRKGDEIHACDGLSLADGQPIAVFRSVFPAFEGLPDALRDEKSVTRALQRVGVDDYTRASTRLSARPATATQALHLKLREGAPVLVSVSINHDARGRPVEFGQTWFSGETVTLTIEDS
jgi:GntR family phosphonate transport system transcriptional regulator